MKVLFLDIETSPNVAYVWGLWQQNVAISQLKENSITLCWAAKWLGEEEVMFDSVFQSSPKKMLRRIHKLLDEADMVVHYYGTKFDIPTLNKEFLVHGMLPPAPYKQVDLNRIVKNKFKFASNKLDYVASRLGLGKKHKTDFMLWVNCLNMDPDAWGEMEAYNRQDVVLLEKLYQKLLPWIRGHANYSLFTGLACCTNCGSNAVVRRGFASTGTLRYQRFRCKDCGTWFRSTVADKQQKGQFINV